MPNLRRPTALLLGLALLSGCAKTHVLIAADELCASWKHQTVRKADQITDATAAIAEGNNKARPAWGCEYGKNKAK